MDYCIQVISLLKKIRANIKIVQHCGMVLRFAIVVVYILECIAFLHVVCYCRNVFYKGLSIWGPAHSRRAALGILLPFFFLPLLTVIQAGNCVTKMERKPKVEENSSPSGVWLIYRAFHHAILILERIKWYFSNGSEAEWEYITIQFLKLLKHIFYKWKKPQLKLCWSIWIPRI